MYVAIRSEQEARELRRLAEELFRRDRRFLLSVAHGNARNDADAQEALSDAFAAFLRAYDPLGGAPPLAWLTLTLKRECWRKIRDAHLDRYLGQEAEDRGSVLDFIPAPGAGLEERVAERDQARRCLGSLKADQRTGLGLLGAGFSYKEIGRLKGWTYTKVNRCIKEGRVALAA